MPIYEFYCTACHVVFSFYAKSAGVKKQPLCPRCQKTLKRQVSIFSLSGGIRGVEDLPVESRRIEQGMKKLEQLGERDPKEAERLRKKFSQFTGVNFEQSKKKPLGDTASDTKSVATYKDPAEKSLHKHEKPPERDTHLYEI